VSPTGEEVRGEKVASQDASEHSQVFKEYTGDVNEIPHYSLLEMNQQTRTLSHSISAMRRAVSKRYLSYQAHVAHLRRSTKGLKNRLLEIAADAGAAAAAVENSAVAADHSEPSNLSGVKATTALLSEAKQSNGAQQFHSPDATKDAESDKSGKANSLSQLMEKFVDGQSNSEDACHAQLLEAKHQLSSLGELVTDLVQEVNTTKKAIIFFDKQLQEKLQETSKIQARKDEQIKKCKKKRERNVELFVKLSQELKEIRQIASPDISMDMSSKSLHAQSALDQEQAESSNEASLLQAESSSGLQHYVAQKLIATSGLMNSTREATLTYNRCMKILKRAQSADQDADTDNGSSDSNSVAPVQVQNDTTPEECKRQRQMLEETYTKTYVELTRLKSHYEIMAKDTTCEDAAQAEFADQYGSLHMHTRRLSNVSGETVKKVKDIKPQLEQASIAEAKIRTQVKRLSEQCGQLGTTVSDLDKVRDVIQAMVGCLRVS